MTKVSIIVPIYNIEDCLGKCLDSLVNQTFKDIEILCINDGSLDDSLKIVEEYEEKYPNLVFGYTKKNGGLSDARNYGLSKAQGEFVMFIDGDDYVSLDMVEKLYNKAVLGNDIVVCNYYKVWDNGKLQGCNKQYLNNYKDFITLFPMAWNKLYKRSLFNEEFKFKKGILYEDLELIPSLVLRTKKIALIDDYLYYYYQRSSSIMNQSEFNDKLLDIFKVLDSLEERFKKHNEYEEYKEELEYLNIEHLLYSASLRFVNFGEKGYKQLDKCIDIIKNKYPNFKNNKYFKNKSIKFKMICLLSYKKHFKVIKMINTLRG